MFKMFYLFCSKDTDWIVYWSVYFVQRQVAGYKFTDHFQEFAFAMIKNVNQLQMLTCWNFAKSHN